MVPRLFQLGFIMKAYETDISIHEYHGQTQIPSKTGLSMILSRPSMYYKHYLAPTELRESFEASKAQREGDAVHCMVLEPETWACRYEVVNTKSRNTKAFKEAQAINLDKVCLTIPEHDNICRMAEALLSDPMCRAYLKLAGKPERTFYYTDLRTGIDLKARPDYISDCSTYAIDIKTTKDISKHSFLADAYAYKYYLSTELIFNAVEAVRGIRPSAYVFLCVENKGEKKPDVDVFYADESMLELAKYRLMESLDKLVSCRKSGIWPCNNGITKALGLPSYGMQTLEKLRKKYGAAYAA